MVRCLDFQKLDEKYFSLLCEFLVSFKLQEMGWHTYRPDYDTGIDRIAHKIDSKGNSKFKTIQIRGSRIEKKGQKKTYGLTIKPKDIIDERHFLIWCCINGKNKPHFLVMSVRDFKETIGQRALNTKSFKKGNYRLHFPLKFGKWRKFLEKFDKLE